MSKSKVGSFSSPLIDLSAYALHDTSKDMVESFVTTKEIAARMAASLKELVWPDNYHVVNTEKALIHLAKELKSHGDFIFDCETQGLNPWRNKLYCISFWIGNEGYVIPLEHQMMSCMDKGLAQKYLKDAFADPKTKRTGHNIKFDHHFIEEQLAIAQSWSFCDTLVQSQVINPDPTTEHGLKQLCAQYGISKMTGDYKDQFGKTAWSYLQWKLACYYAIRDCELTGKLKIKQDEMLEGLTDWKTGETKLKSLFWDVEMPMVNLTYQMERTGILTDPDYYNEKLRPTVYKEWEAAANTLAPFIRPHLKFVEADTVISVLDSPSKLAKIFFDKLDVPLIKYVTLKSDKDRQFTIRSLDKDAISGLSRTCEPIRLLGNYRKWATVKKMFVDAYPTLVSAKNRMHPSMNVIGAATGRMSLSKPNLQQVPSRMGALVRNLYIPEPDHILLSIDVAGQEMRLLADYTQDYKLKNFYLNPNGLDIYSQTAIDAFPSTSFAKSKTTREAFAIMGKNERKEINAYRDAKSLVLGLGYGMGHSAYGRKTGKTSAEGKADFNAYHSAYPGIGVFHEKCKEFTRKYGYMTTKLGRRRYFPFINSTGENGLRAAAERGCLNEPIQGSAADQIKLAVLKSWKLINKNKWPIRIVLIVHDELVFDLPKAWAKDNHEAIAELKMTVCNALPLSVPVEVSETWSNRWGTEKDFDDIDEEFENEEAS
jgi:DNA polymerase-1